MPRKNSVKVNNEVESFDNEVESFGGIINSRPKVDPDSGMQIPFARYQEFLHELADKESKAAHYKLLEHGLDGGYNVLALLQLSADYMGADANLHDAYWAYMGRHLGALAQHEALNTKSLRKRLMDLYGYVTLGLIMMDVELANEERFEERR
jgi:hypothetical protein